MVKAAFHDALLPIQTQMDSLEGKIMKNHKKEEVDVSKLVKPLASKFDAIKDQVEENGANSAKVKENVEGIKKNMKETSAATQVVGSAIKGIEETAQQMQTDVAGLNKGVNEKTQLLKKLSASIDDSLDDVATKDGLKQVVQQVKGNVKDHLQDAAKNIKKSVESTVKSAGATQKSIHKVAAKNQKYLKRIYKDLHHR